MTTIQTMMHAHPKSYAVDLERLVAAIDATTECAQVCTACADACLAEDMIADLRRCIRLDLDCTDVCLVTARLLSRQTEPDIHILHTQLETCVRACKACGDECQKHAEMHEHCRVCADSCRHCSRACEQVLGTLA